MMNETNKKLFDCINDGDVEKKEAQEINKALADMENITEEQQENVKEYLLNSLNMKSLDPTRLDNLLFEIDKFS